MNLQLDGFLDTLERAGSTAAVVPVVGTVTGALKVAGGAVQVTAAVACAILLIIPLAIMGEEGAVDSLMDHCWTHIKHGMGNILAGTLEAIPLVGTIGYIWRNSLYASTINTPYSQLEKFMPYQSLVWHDALNGKVT